MGRLQALVGVLGVLLATAACDDTNKRAGAAPPANRREAVLAPSSAKPAAVVPSASAAKAVPHKARVLCAGAALNREFPGGEVGRADPNGSSAQGASLPVGNGKWTWVNLWAAWCGPCKEEMPRLFRWQAQLGTKTRFVFVSLDDDERQLLRFLRAQPNDGLRSSYWLPEGKVRDTWLRDMNLSASPELPVQILVDPRGRVHCIIEGAVEDSDYPRVASIITHR